MHCLMTISAILCGLLACANVGAEQRSLAVVWDGIETFDQATAENAMSARARVRATAGGVTKVSVYLHPNTRGLATVAYPPLEHRPRPGERMFLLTYAGIRDGFDWDDEENPPDGARFYVLADGEQVARTELAAHMWMPLVAELHEAPAHEPAVFVTTLTLATDSGPDENANYDWAHFGEPVVVAVDGRHLPPGAAVDGSGGVLIAGLDGGAGSLIVEGLDAQGNPLPDAVASADAPEGADHAFVRFDFATVEECVAWRWRAEGAQVAEAWGGSWEPRLVIEHLGPAQAVSFVGEPRTMRVAVRNTGKGALLAEHGAEVVCNGVRAALGHIPPDEVGVVEFTLDAGAGAPERIEATVRWGEHRASLTVDGPPPAWPSLPAVPAGRPQGSQARQVNADYLLIQNPHVRWLIWTGRPGLGALVYTWIDDDWELAGAVDPWLEIVLSETAAVSPPLVDLRAEVEDGRAVLRGAATTDEGLACRIVAELPPDSPALRVALEVEAVRATELAALRGPAVRAGDRGPGADKGIAIFPGLEYLENEEPSSSDRDLAPPLHKRWTPHRFKVTVPMMMVETRDGGPVMAVIWDATQRWDGEHIAPGASFASPDFLTHQDNHLMRLMLPSVPEFIPEHGHRTEEPLRLEQGATWRLEQHILAARPEPDATAAMRWFEDLVGYPEAEDWPRSFEEEIALCRHGFMHTVWDEETHKSRHVVGWGPANAPGFATLMLMDARAVARGEAKEQVMERVKLIGEQTLTEQGAAGLASGALCHIMRWEFPYHWGHLPGALTGMRDNAHSALRSQEADGGWGFQPGERQRELGEPGTRVSGICGRNAYTLAKWAAISGEPEVLAGMQRAMECLRRYRVPRGAQGWECPILQPDVLASAYALRACVWAYMATGDEQLLDDARFWARTGLPFQYAWDDGERPGMRYASIPVFGSTFYVHTWIGLPVQWCGLVYAYGLQELMRFDPDDIWRRQVEGMTVSAMHQQWDMDNEELAGSYPDAFGDWFTRRVPVFIGPENIQLNLLAMQGLDPGLRTVPVGFGGGLVQVTAPADLSVTAQDDGLLIEASYLPGEIMYLTLAPVAPTAQASFVADGVALERADDLPPGSLGWTYNEQLRILSVGVRCDGEGKTALTARGIERTVIEAPVRTERWEFETDAQGWTAANACEVTWHEGALRITARGHDPYATGGAADIDADRHKRLRLRARMTGGSQVGLFWRSTVSEAWGPNKEVKATLEGDGQWREIVFDLGGHPLWAGTVVQIRLDIEPPDVPPGTTLDVDWIRPE